MAANPRFLQLLDEMKNIHVAKNAGYSGKDNPDAFANFRMSERFGVSAFLGCLIRLSDKFIRVSNLVKDASNEMIGESIKDTLLDLACYALIAICLLEEQSKE
jgi:hypothetical protein